MASLLKVDALTGVTTAGSISVTGEGNSTTTNLQQGLAKLWIQATSASSVSTEGSFNVSSLTDVAAGALFPNATNSFANDDYAVSCVSNNYHVTITDMQTGGFRYTSHNSSHTGADSSKACATVHGGLA
jgi:roadblock/LC7 domain-containing protein